MKIGRNEPCPCGSGRKYKKCCLGKEDVSVDLLWRRLGETHDRLADRLMKHAMNVFGEEGIGEALFEFLLWPEDDAILESSGNHEELFYPWFLFNWIYDPEDAETELRGPAYTTVAESCANERRTRLDPLERRLIEATVRKPFSFYEVVRCQPGRGYQLKDIFRGVVADVLEKMGSQNARAGDIIFARVVQVDSVAMLVGCGSVLIPPKMKPVLINFRNWLLESNDPITADTLNEFDVEFRDLYFDIYDALMRPPELRNTDGDPMSFHTIHFEIESPELAFNRLKSLSVVESEEDLRTEAELDDAGRIRRVTIHWSRKGHKKTKALENTVLGRLEIDGRRLKVEVNSARRAKIIRKEVDIRLGKHGRYITTEIQSPASMPEAMGDRADENPDRDGEQDELMQIPEVREQMEKVLSGHWKGWVDEEIPALGDKTPRQAVKTCDGRESVEALLLDAERRAGRNQQMGDIELMAIADVRRCLRLDKTDPAGTKSGGGSKKAERVDAIKSLIEDFGRAKLTPKYIGFALKLCDRIARMRKLSIQRGRVEIWAAAIIHVIARLNFLFDPENEMNITADELCAFLGTKKSTVSSKAGHIQKACDLYLGDAEFSSAEIARMFRIYETEEGLLIPGFMLDENEDAQRRRSTSPATNSEVVDGKKKPRRAKARERSQLHDKAKSKSDDRQLKLFNDD